MNIVINEKYEFNIDLDSWEKFRWIPHRFVVDYRKDDIKAQRYYGCRYIVYIDWLHMEFYYCRLPVD